MAYNGWSNFETWNVTLWIDQDKDSFHYWRELLREIRSKDSEHTIPALADALEDYYLTKDMAADPALSKVNWREIAENMLMGKGPSSH